ncbi:MAG: DUF2975 domain-containing protein [Bacteroidales bacterium]
MKKRLNLICFLLFAALLVSLSMEIAGGVAGYKEALVTVNEKEADKNEIYTIRLNPTTPGTYTDSVYNTRQEAWIPIQYNEILTKVEKNISQKELIGVLALSVALLITLVIAFISFVNLIRNINRSVIFSWVNVRNLNILGIALLASFAIGLILGYVNYSSILNQIDIPGYEIAWGSIVQTTNLILGLASLLIAEIFSIGLRLKEEQDLTI